METWSRLTVSLPGGDIRLPACRDISGRDVMAQEHLDVGSDSLAQAFTCPHG